MALMQFKRDPYGVHRYYDKVGNRVRAGTWMPTHYAYVSEDAQVILLVSDKPSLVWAGQEIALTKRGSEEVKSLQGLEGPGTYYTVHKHLVEAQ